MSGFENVEKACGYTFKDKALLQKALTLSSYDNDNNNESLECLGDALLTFIVAEKFYAENLDEGGITEKKQQLISDEALRPVSERLGLDKALRRDKGDNSNKKSVPSAYEAITAAIYLDGGLEAARKFALSTLTPLPDAVNYVAELNEICPAAKYDKSMDGSRHTVYLTIDDGTVFNGEGSNFKEAKKLAAKAAYEYIKNKR